MKKLLYLIRAEADFERVIALAISGKGRFNQEFIFAGDTTWFYSNGILNIFQKKLFETHGFTMKDISDFDWKGRILKKFCFRKSAQTAELPISVSLLFSYIAGYLLKKIVFGNKIGLVNKALYTIKPDALITDQSMTSADYLPEIFRREGKKRGIPSFLITHGAAGGLHSVFSKEAKLESYEGYNVLICNDAETQLNFINRVKIGDMTASKKYLDYIHALEIDDIDFHNDRKYKISFIVGGTIPTLASTNGWSKMEELIIGLSERPDVAMIVKLHPREAPYIDLRFLKSFGNVLVVGRERDRSRVVKWANIVVCSDHCSAVFEPMILGKKVVAIEGKHLPRYQHLHSCLKESSIKHISKCEEFSIDNIPNANPEDHVIRRICLGDNCIQDDIADAALQYILDRISK